MRGGGSRWYQGGPRGGPRVVPRGEGGIFSVKIGTGTLSKQSLAAVLKNMKNNENVIVK